MQSKVRDIIFKLGLKKISSVSRVTIRKSKKIVFVINKPIIYKNSSSHIYNVFSDAKSEDLSIQALMEAAHKLIKSETSELAHLYGGNVEPQDVLSLLRKKGQGRPCYPS
ncbi:EGD2 [Lepeophtheirus salmonis]|uniref:EGD2 n=1 Tax=Lepeophtheirus salmonis TaxID=72036 RepID=A0A7R8D8Z6_LEPSM|nr:EGD2 [Lepeophtheirus salmonis]CAF3040507.1 EGD2 [Lepeophtheirus salmonis]